MNETAEETLEYNVNITAVQEVPWKDSGKINKKNFTFFYSGSERKQGEYGTEFIVHAKTKQSIIGFEPVNNQISKIRVKGKFYNMTIINVYAPTEETDEEVKEVFYEEIQLVINRIPNNDLIVIVGDYNAKTGKEVACQNVSGKYSLHDIMSNNGEKVCSLAEANQLMVMSTCFEHK